MVPVERQATGTSDPAGRKVEILKPRTASRTSPGCVGGVYKGDLTTGAFSLVREVGAEGGPTAVQDALTQVVISDQMADTQIFQRQAVVVAHQVGAQLVQEVGAPISDVCLLALDRPQRFLAVLASPYGACQFAPQHSEALLPSAVEGGRLHLDALTGRDER